MRTTRAESRTPALDLLGAISLEASGLVAAMLLATPGCGSVEVEPPPLHGSASRSTEATPPPRGAFAGFFHPVQSDEAGAVELEGTARIRVDEDSMSVQVRASGLAPDMTHAMFVHAGSTCADAAHDENDDGWLDAAEARRGAGNSLIALDDDLADDELQAFPRAGPDGRLEYRASAPLQAILDGLGPSAFRLQPADNVVQILGVDGRRELPATVESFGDAPWRMLPAACAELDLVGSP